MLLLIIFCFFSKSGTQTVPAHMANMCLLDQKRDCIFVLLCMCVGGRGMSARKPNFQKFDFHILLQIFLDTFP